MLLGGRVRFHLIMRHLTKNNMFLLKLRHVTWPNMIHDFANRPAQTNPLGSLDSARLIPEGFKNLHVPGLEIVWVTKRPINLFQNYTPRVATVIVIVVRCCKCNYSNLFRSIWYWIRQKQVPEVPVVRVAMICQYSTETISTSSNAMDLIIPIYHSLSISIHTPVNTCMCN